MNTVLVTEGTHGMGASLCRAFQREGYRVVAAHSADPETAKSFSEETNIPTYSWDCCDWEACLRNVTHIEKEHGNIAVLVNPLMAGEAVTLSDMTPQHWKHVLDTQLHALFYMCKSVVSSMCARGNCRIINIAPLMQMEEGSSRFRDHVAKASMVGLTQFVAQEVAPYGVTANVVAPAGIRTKQLEDMETSTLEALMRAIPLKRMGVPEEVAEVVLFLASTRGAFITGATLHINGGQWMV